MLRCLKHYLLSTLNSHFKHKLLERDRLIPSTVRKMYLFLGKFYWNIGFLLSPSISINHKKFSLYFFAKNLSDNCLKLLNDFRFPNLLWIWFSIQFITSNLPNVPKDLFWPVLIDYCFVMFPLLHQRYTTTSSAMQPFQINWRNYLEGVLKNFAKFTGKHLCRSRLLVRPKIILIRPKTLNFISFCWKPL